MYTYLLDQPQRRRLVKRNPTPSSTEFIICAFTPCLLVLSPRSPFLIEFLIVLPAFVCFRSNIFFLLGRSPAARGLNLQSRLVSRARFLVQHALWSLLSCPKTLANHVRKLLHSDFPAIKSHVFRSSKCNWNRQFIASIITKVSSKSKFMAIQFLAKFKTTVSFSLTSSPFSKINIQRVHCFINLNLKNSCCKMTFQT